MTPESLRAWIDFLTRPANEHDDAAWFWKQEQVAQRLSAKADAGSTPVADLKA